jgi:hypothetical protein
MPNKKTNLKLIIGEAPLVTATTRDTRVLFEGRKNYLFQYDIYFDKSLPVIDTWYNSTMYGKLNHIGEPIEAKKEFLKNLTTNNIVSSANYYVLDFVADAYADMRKEVEQKIKFGKVKKTPILNLIAKGNFEQLDVSYKTREKFIIDTFLSKITPSNKLDSKIKDYNSFIKIFIDVLSVLPNERITKANHLLSYKTPINVSGLVIELSNNNPNDDLKKYENFFVDENFLYFQRTCYKYGFILDKNIPSRMVFQPSLPQSAKYLEKYEITSLADLFDKRYNKLFLNDFINFKKLTLKCYNQLVKNKNYTQSYKICGDYKNVKFTKSKRIKRFLFTEEIINKKYNNLFWMKIYLYIFMKENKVKLTQQRFDSILNTVQMFYNMSESNAIKFLQTLCCSIKKIPANGLNTDPALFLTSDERATILPNDTYKLYF